MGLGFRVEYFNLSSNWVPPLLMVSVFDHVYISTSSHYSLPHAFSNLRFVDDRGLIHPTTMEVH